MALGYKYHTAAACLLITHVCTRELHDCFFYFTNSILYGRVEKKKKEPCPKKIQGTQQDQNEISYLKVQSVNFFIPLCHLEQKVYSNFTLALISLDSGALKFRLKSLLRLH